MKIEIADIGQLPEVARNLLESFGEERFFAFFGKMGVGKTTLIKELCAALGVEDIVCSPTFAIVNEYSRPLITHHSSLITESEPVYHFDFYRLKSIAEAYDIGYEEYSSRIRAEETSRRLTAFFSMPVRRPISRAVMPLLFEISE